MGKRNRGARRDAKILQPKRQMNEPETDGRRNDAKQSTEALLDATVVRTTEINPTPTTDPQAQQAEHGREPRKHWMGTFKTTGRLIAGLFMDVVRFLDKYAGAVTAVATIAICVLTYEYVTYSKKQWQAMSEANKLSRESLATVERHFVQDQRPYVVISELASEQSKESIQMSANGAVRVDIRFTNFGRSPAINLTTRTKMWTGEANNVIGKKLEQWFSSLPASFGSEGALPLPPVVGDGGPRTAGFRYTSLHSDRPVTPGDMAFIKTHEGALVIAARSSSQDISGNWYYTDFCEFNLATGAIAICADHNTIH